LCPINLIARDDELTFRFRMNDQNGVNITWESMVITGPLEMWLDEDAAMYLGACTYDPITTHLTVVFDNEIIDGVVPIIRGWQQNVRGPNGEWLAPLVFETPVVPP
jgi:hypothetical protein